MKLRQQLANQIGRFFFKIRKLHVENDEAYLINYNLAKLPNLTF